MPSVELLSSLIGFPKILRPWLVHRPAYENGRRMLSTAFGSFGQVGLCLLETYDAKISVCVLSVTLEEIM